MSERPSSGMFQLVVAYIEPIPSWVYDAPPDVPLKLEYAIWVPELAQQFSEKQLRTAIASGRLPAEQHGRTLYVTRAGLKEWRENCRVKPSPPASGSARPALRVVGSPTGRPSGSSSTLDARSALDAALAIAQGLRRS